MAKIKKSLKNIKNGAIYTEIKVLRAFSKT